MTVYVETLKSSGMQIKGEVKRFDGVRKIIEEDNRMIYWVNENWQTVWAKDMHRILAITY